MSLQEFGHTESSDFILAEDWLHLFVRVEELFVLGILQLLLLDVGPESLHNLGSAQLLALLGADEVSKLVTEAERLGQSASLWHFCCWYLKKECI